METPSNLGEFEIVVLAALLHLGDDAYGMFVRREIEQRCGRAASIGAVYTTLSRLGKKGYVRSWIGEPSPTRGGRAKRYFQITAAGSRALKQSVRRLDRMVRGLVAGWSTT